MAWLTVLGVLLGLAVGVAGAVSADRQLVRLCGSGLGAWGQVGVVAVCTGLFTGVAWRFGWSWSLPAEWAFAGGLGVLAVCDARRLLLPRRVVAASAVVTSAALLVAAGVGSQWVRLAVALASAAVVFGMFFVVNLFRPDWLGYGDVRLAGLVGLGLGWLGPGAVLAGLIAGNVIGLFAAGALALAGRVGWHTRLPYGTFVAAGAAVALLISSPGTRAFGASVGH